MKRITLIMSFLLAFYFIANAQEQIVLHSGKLNKADTVRVFKPANYSKKSTQSFPLVYLLNGWNGNYKQWNNIIDCQSYADKYQFVIVCPDGLSDSWYINSPTIKGSQYADFFFMDLMPLISKKYKVDQNNVFITGLSMGGHGALYLFEQKPELFRSAGSTSGVMDISYSKDKYGLKKILGLKGDSTDHSLLKKYSVVGNIDKIAAAGKEIIFSCGTEDPFYQVNNEFRKKCDELKIKAIYISAPGAHNNDFWKFSIKYHFDFFKSLVHFQ